MQWLVAKVRTRATAWQGSWEAFGEVQIGRMDLYAQPVVSLMFPIKSWQHLPEKVAWTSTHAQVESVQRCRGKTTSAQQDLHKTLKPTHSLSLSLSALGVIIRPSKKCKDKRLTTWLWMKTLPSNPRGLGSSCDSVSIWCAISWELIRFHVCWCAIAFPPEGVSAEENELAAFNTLARSSP